MQTRRLARIPAFSHWLVVSLAALTAATREGAARRASAAGGYGGRGARA